MKGIEGADAAGGFLTALTPEERDRLTSMGTHRRYRAGTFLVSEGASSDHVIAVLSGRVKVCSYTTDGREVVLAVRGPGELIGELSVLDGEPRSAAVAALEDTEVVTIPAEAFLRFLTEHARVAVLLLRILTRRLRESGRRQVEYGAFDITERITLRLVELAEEYGVPEGEGVAIDLPLTQEELASWTGSSREAVSKALRTLRSRGLVETKRRRIIVRDLDALRRFAG